MNPICPRCLCSETIRLDLDDGDTLTCSGCDENYRASDLVAMLDSWAGLLPWIMSHPARRPEPAPYGVSVPPSRNPL